MVAKEEIKPEAEQEYYGLEEHLASFRNWPNGQLLYSSWLIDKQRLRERLKAVPIQYPHYSMHDDSHSAKILMNIEMFLGEERIRQLSASDTWMLLKCAYSHDIGMTMPAEELQKEFAKDKDLYKKLKDMCMKTPRLQSAFVSLSPLFMTFSMQADNDEDWEDRIFEEESAAAALEALNQDELIMQRQEIWPMEVINNLSAIIEEYARPKHNQYSKEILKRENDECKYDFIPLRLRLMVGKIANLHGGGPEDVTDNLPHRAIGVCNDHLHPRFCAYLLRAGDLLDMDNGRFNKHHVAVSGKNETSLLHILKHDSIETFEISEREIVVKANFRTEKVTELRGKSGDERRYCIDSYIELQRWMKWLEEELRYFANYWFDIVPKDTAGFCPQLRNIEYRIDSELIHDDEATLKYNISTQRAAELIEGADLYTYPELTFLRELIQNAVDATKIQMYRDVCDGRYPRFAQSDLINLTPYCFFERMGDSLQQYRVDVKVEFRYSEDDGTGNNHDISALVVKVRDYGIGITYADLKRMQNIGNIIKPEVEREIENMPEWIRPTGSFGIGLQSIFFVAKSFKVRSRPYGHDRQMGYQAMREMTFYSSKLGGNIRVQLCDDNEAENFGYGTEVIVEIPLDTYYGRTLFMRKLLEKMGEYDVFSNEKNAIRCVIDNYLSRIYSPIGISVRLLPNESEKSPRHDLAQCLEKAQKAFSPPEPLSMAKIFGRFCILRDEDIVKLDDSNDKAVRKEDNNSLNLADFSVWNKKENILIKYSSTETERHNTTAIYYKGILVEDKTSYLSLPFFSAEVHILGDRADRILKINRESFLNEKMEKIIGRIQNSHLCAMAYIARTLPRYPDLWFMSGNAYACMLLISRYINKNLDIADLADGLNIRDLTIPSALYNKEQSYYEERNGFEIMLKQPLSTSLWFYNASAEGFIKEATSGFIGTAGHSANVEEKETIHESEPHISALLPDYFFQFRRFAIKEAVLVESLSRNPPLPKVIYKIGLRTGEPLTMKSWAYEEYCRAIFYYAVYQNRAEQNSDIQFSRNVEFDQKVMKYKLDNMIFESDFKHKFASVYKIPKDIDIDRERGSQTRLVFPAVGTYPGIEVKDIPDRWQRGNMNRIFTEISKFDSWVISPINFADLFDLKAKYDKICNPNSQNSLEEFMRLADCYLDRVSRLFFRYVRRNCRKKHENGAFCDSKGGRADEKDIYKGIKDSYKKWMIYLFSILKYDNVADKKLKEVSDHEQRTS